MSSASCLSSTERAPGRGLGLRPTSRRCVAPASAGEDGPCLPGGCCEAACCGPSGGTACPAGASVLCRPPQPHSSLEKEPCAHFPDGKAGPGVQGCWEGPRPGSLLEDPSSSPLTLLPAAPAPPLSFLVLLSLPSFFLCSPSVLFLCSSAFFSSFLRSVLLGGGDYLENQAAGSAGGSAV